MRLAIEATREVVASNTNLGIVLLLAPLAAVPRLFRLTAGMEAVLDALTVDDASQVFAAIRLAQPGGLGTVPREDIRREPTRPLRDVMALAHRDVFRIGPRNSQALAWEISDKEPTIIEKYGGLNNASAYIGIMPSRKLGIVILGNRGNQYPNEPGRRILLELAAARE